MKNVCGAIDLIYQKLICPRCFYILLTLKYHLPYSFSVLSVQLSMSMCLLYI